MEDLPPPLLIDILNRLPTATDLTNLRLVSKTLNSLSYSVTSTTLLCSYHHHFSTTSSSSSSSFKLDTTRFIPQLPYLDSISIGVDTLLQELSYDDVVDEYDHDHDRGDLYLTDVDFVKGWLPKGLKSLSVVDFWVQSCWRKSGLLAYVSFHCQKLTKLEVKNAWLSVDGVSSMSALTSLTLDFVRLDDENLEKLNDCCPCLKTLNLLGVGGLNEPKIHLKHLKRCRWTVSNVPLSLTIAAPEMVELKLKCVKPRSLVLETPLLTDFHLTLDKADTFDIGDLPYLRTLRLESSSISNLIHAFPCSKAVNELSLDTRNWNNQVNESSFYSLFDVFPNVNSINLGPGAYSDMEAFYVGGELEGRIEMKGLKEFTAYLVIRDIDVTLSFISFILDKCNNLSAISLLIHHEIDSLIASNIMSRSAALCPRVQWKWGIWKEGSKDAWLSDGV